METSDDESSGTIDSFPGIIVNRYRLTDCTLPLYINPFLLPFFIVSDHSGILCVRIRYDHNERLFVVSDNRITNDQSWRSL